MDEELLCPKKNLKDEEVSMLVKDTELIREAKKVRLSTFSAFLEKYSLNKSPLAFRKIQGASVARLFRMVKGREVSLCGRVNLTFNA